MFYYIIFYFILFILLLFIFSCILKGISSFLQFFNSPDQEKTRIEFFKIISKELQTVERIGIKYNEKHLQKRSKFSKTLQDKNNKDRQINQKVKVYY